LIVVRILSWPFQIGARQYGRPKCRRAEQYESGLRAFSGQMMQGFAKYGKDAFDIMTLQVAEVRVAL
jgi:hypothetical protein